MQTQEKHLCNNRKQILSTYSTVECYGAHSAAFPALAGGRSAPSLTSLHIVETNQEITAQSCATPESCRYTLTTRTVVLMDEGIKGKHEVFS